MDKLKECVNNAIDYPTYKKQVESLVKEKKTSGLNQSPELSEYTAMNLQRMNRNEKKVELNNELIETLANNKRPLLWLTLSEAWCGDAAQNLPVLNKIAEASPDITLKVVYRDENPALMDQFLTNGTKSIPKLICVDAETKELLGTWGPRPSGAVEILTEHKKQVPAESHDEFVKKLHLWYAKDKGMNLQKELVELLKEWQNKKTGTYLCN